MSIYETRPPSLGFLLVFALALAGIGASCAHPAQVDGSSGAEKTTLTIGFTGPSSKSIVYDVAGSISKLDVAASVGASVVATSPNVTYGAGVTTSLSLPPGSYTISVNAKNATGTVIAAGSAQVELLAEGTKALTVPLSSSLAQSATGSFSFIIEWPRSTLLPYVSASLDGVDLGAITVTTGTSYYTATLAKASGVTSGSRLLAISFKASSGATVTEGPFLESVNVWDGVKSTMWVASDGTLKDRRSFLADEIPDSDASLADFSLSAPAGGLDFAPDTTSFSIYSPSATTLSFAATLSKPGQAISYTWNGDAQSWASVSATGYASIDLTVNSAISNVLVVDVTAPDRKSHRAYTVSLGTTMATFDPSNNNLKLSGSLSAADLATLKTSLAARTTPFTIDLSDAIVPSNTLDSTFSYINYMTAITLPNSCTTIGNGSLSNCPSLTSIVIPDSVTTISSNAIMYLSSLTTISVPSSVTSMASNVFAMCAKLTDVNIDSANTVYSSVDGVVYNKAQTILYHYPYAKTATSYTVLTTVTAVGSMALYECANLTTIVLPNGLTSIGSMAFIGCGITSITLPSTLLSIDGAAFWSCSSLSAISIPASVTSIGEAALARCSNLATITVDSGSTAFSSLDGALYDKTQTILYCCPDAKTSFTIPGSVTTISPRAFMGCSKLTALDIPSLIGQIGYEAFNGCSALAAVTCYPGTAPTLGTSAFTGTSASLKIFVPTASHASYETNWSAYSAYLVDY